MQYIVSGDSNIIWLCMHKNNLVFTILGKSTYDIDILEKMIGSGMNIALLNMNFGPREEHVEVIKMLRAAARNFSTKMGKNYPLGIAMRLSGRKIRTGRIADVCTIIYLIKC